MSLKQTRRSVSVSGVAFAAATERAAKEGITVAALVTAAFRAYGIDIPETEHRSRAQAERAMRSRARHKAVAALPPAHRRPLVKRKPKPHQKPGIVHRDLKPSNVTPGRDALQALYAECSRKVPRTQNDSLAMVEARKRKVSLIFAAELRKRGWLRPELEGYAPGSWADPNNAKEPSHV